MRLLWVLLLAFPAPLHALEYCEELWFTRNLIFHKAGYCFGSTLGKSVFGNGGCTGKSAALDPVEEAMVARLKDEERIEGCRVDTSARSLPIERIEERKTLRDPPFPSLYESGCIGYLGAPFPLLSGRGIEGVPIAEARPGDDLLFQFENVDNWHFVEVSRDGVLQGFGWAPILWEETSCDMFAG